MTHPISQSELDAVHIQLKAFKYLDDKTDMCELFVSHVSRLLDEVVSLRSMLGRAGDALKPFSDCADTIHELNDDNETYLMTVAKREDYEQAKQVLSEIRGSKHESS